MIKKNSYINKKNGITLVALVVTIVVLLILIGITVTYMIGDNGIFSQALKVKEEMEKAKLIERMEFVIADWETERRTKTDITLDNLWDRLIEEDIITNKKDVTGPEKEGDNDIYWLDTTEGYVVEIIVSPDGSVSRGDTIKGDKLPPKVVAIDVTNKNSNSISVEVTVRRTEEGKLSYYYKKEEETTYYELTGKQDTTDLTADFTNLEQNKVYNIKVVAKNKEGTGELVINVLTGELEVGEIRQKGETIWSNGKASIELETTNTKLTLKYQINRIDGTWLSYEGRIGNLNHKDTVYAVLTDGTNYGEEASIEINDGIDPTAMISNLPASVDNGTNITATVVHQDNESGIRTGECRWVFTTSNAKIGTVVESYTGGRFSSNSQNVTWKTTIPGTYYLHVLTVDNAGRRTETVSATGVTVNQLITGTANSEHVLTGQTFSNANGIGLNGTMPNKGSLNFNPSNSTSYTVQPGYYGGGTLSSANAYNGGYEAGKNDSKIYYGDGKVIWQAYIEGTKPVFGLEMPSDCVQVVAVTFKYGGNSYAVGLDDQVWDYNINNSYRDTTLKDTLKESKNLAIKKPGTANATDVKVFYLKTKQF